MTSKIPFTFSSLLLYKRIKKMRMMRFWIFLLVIFFSPFLAKAEGEVFIHNKIQDIKTVWNSDKWELYIPVNTWHNRWTYKKEKIKEYNERPWGAGLGKYYIDDKGNWHALYAMTFQDSHNDPEPTFGYAWMTYGYPDKKKNWRFGIGYTLGLTFRSDYDYLPLPMPLPVFEIGYKRLSIQTTYIPGGNGSGNILFTWLKWQF